LGDSRQLWRAVQDRRSSGEPRYHVWAEVERNRAEREAAPMDVRVSPVVARVTAALAAGHAAEAVNPSLLLSTAEDAPVTPAKVSRRRGSRRLLLSASYVLSLAAVAALAGGATFGLFSATASSSSDSFTAGTVTQNSTVTGGCLVSNMLPTGVANPCGTLEATYVGSVSGYMAIDVLVETQPGAQAGATPLYSGGGSSSGSDLLVTVTSTSPGVTYTIPTSSTSCPGTAPAHSVCYELDDELVSTGTFSNGSPQVQFQTSVKLPTSSPTTDQGGAAEIYLTAHAVQARNNALPTGCVSAGAGVPCTTETWK
jgi:predicted ribosomally synthesized peptide with SipW-like signal peptide